ncbi:MAG: Acetyltransferase AcuA, acetyl-CoA synthetase inhibitor [Brockia lithotrophica]|uniref:Acetyltransferase AcuA, acetyl-CoA synthetase inhibitor n=1 Tax=Brockia lithotrophica TaxID=933949 RepID=A0A2T5G7F3_9BACL|nr:MAG: Acetyltransferase AcuA, acetyl-CoA synthetase inhibitor [Brockia lithotrophica]
MVETFLHRKTPHRRVIPVEHGPPIVVEGPLPPEELRSLRMHPELDAFRPPERQKEALVEIAGLPEGRVIVAKEGDTIVGYATFHAPDEIERWALARDPRILELGAIEVSPPYRGRGLARTILEVAFADEALEEYIVFTTEYYWHWDLERTGLDVWGYRKLMENLMRSVGMYPAATDDPEIVAHPANALMVRIGARVPMETIERFDRVRFMRRPLY